MKSQAIAGRLPPSDPSAFQDLAEPYRRELQLHCYRMLGSVHDAEDAVQEAFVRAWNGHGGYAGGEKAIRRWLYKVATNTCLNVLAGRKRSRRFLPDALGAPAHDMPRGFPVTEISWLEPYPDAYLEGIADTLPGPPARYEAREAVSFAFVAAIQHLPPRQRAALLLCDVLGWTAAETAQLLDSTVASVNSALQRARATLSKQPEAKPIAPARLEEAQNALLTRYMQVWERMDIAGLAAILRDDAVYSMPPWREWYSGQEAIVEFFRWAWSSRAYGGFRLVPTWANGQPAFAVYSRSQEPDAPWRPHSLHLLTIDGDGIARLTLFVDPLGPSLFPAFGLAGELQSEDR